MTRSAPHILAELLGVPYAEKRELLTEFVEALAPPQNEAMRQSWARGQVAMTEEPVAKSSYDVMNAIADEEQETIREIARRAAARATRKADDDVAHAKPTPQPGDRVDPDDVGVGDVVREQALGDCCDTRLTRRDEAGNWHGVVVYSSDNEWIAEGMGNAVAFVSRAVTLVSRAEPAPPQPPPIQLQVGHRYLARDRSEWDCAALGANELRLLCRSVTTGATYSYCANGEFIAGKSLPYDIIEDLGPTPSAKPEIDVDAVLAPLRALESVLRDRSVAKNEYSIQAMDAYAETVNLLSEAIAKAREAAK